MGVKGIGESGAIAAPLAVINAVIDALSHEGVTHMTCQPPHAGVADSERLEGRDVRSRDADLSGRPSLSREPMQDSVDEVWPRTSSK